MKSMMQSTPPGGMNPEDIQDGGVDEASKSDAPKKRSRKSKVATPNS
jgi:hypothetical protein